MSQAVIVSAARTAIGKENGGLRDVLAEDITALVMNEAVRRSGIPDPALIDEIIFGNCWAALAHMGRVASIKAGLPLSIPSIQIDRQCGSGSTAVNLAASLIRAGDGEIMLAGGVESMTRMPYVMAKPTVAYQRNAPKMQHLWQWPVVPEGMGGQTMGITAENVAEQWKISREVQDEFAYFSQLKTARALEEGRFKEQIIPVIIPQKKGDPIVFDTDEFPRPGTTLEQLAKLKPAFKDGGTVTAGTSSGINDGAAAMVLASVEKAKELGLRPLARVVEHAAAGVDPNIMGIGPVPASRKALAKAGLKMADMDVIELNEAFAAQSVACCQELDIDWRDRDRDRVNPNGGAISLGHPIAASLAILMVKAVYELQRRQGRYALITACIGGGQGVATIIERC